MNSISPVAHPQSAVSHNPWLSHPVRIRSRTSEIPDVITFELEFLDADLAARYRFLPGQFNMLYLPGAGEIAISISADPESRTSWAHTVRTAGTVTQTLSRMQAGDTLGLRGPYGTPWPLEQCLGQDVILVAGGIGLAPLRPVLYHLLHHREQFGKITLLLGARTPEGLLYEQEYPAWKSAGIDMDITVDRATPDWQHNVGVVTLMLDRLPLPRPVNTVLLMCGPEVMMHYTMKSAVKRGLTLSQLWLSSERNMQCAVGLCGHCQLGPTFVCQDGPVFRYDVLEPFLKVADL